MRLLTTRSLALLAILSALCIGIQLAPRPLPNVEATSLLVFIVGVFFGIFIGSGLGLAVMIVNGFLSHWGFAGLMLPFQIAGMVLIGTVGALYGRTKKGVFTPNSCIEAALLGAFLTLIYDIITNFGVSLSQILIGTPILPAIVSTIISGVPFSVIHIVSNFFVFLTAFFPMIKALQAAFGGENVWRRSSLPM